MNAATLTPGIRTRRDSVREDNAQQLARECPFVYVSQILGSRWRPAIVWKIHSGIATYNALREGLAPITDKMLASELQILIEDALVMRIELSERPRRTRYELTPRGASLLTVLAAMETWAATDRASRA